MLFGLLVLPSLSGCLCQVLKALILSLSCLFTACEQNTINEVENEQVVAKPEQQEEKPNAQIAQRIPKRCAKYVEYFLMAENPSLWAAQIDQESTCNPFAQSPYAVGIAQFTPATGHDLAKRYCSDLGPFKKFDVKWQLTCGLRYEENLEKSSSKLFPAVSYCDNKRIGQQRYNGGYWVVWEINHFGSVEDAKTFCGHVRLPNGRKRSTGSCKENYEYPVRIAKRQNNFMALGGQSCSLTV